MYRLGMMGILGLFMASPVEGKPRWAEATTPSVAVSAEAPAPPAVTTTKTAKGDDLAKYQQAQTLLASKVADDLAQSAMLFAELTGSTDRDLADAARRRFDKALTKLSAIDSSRAVGVVVEAWRRYGRQGGFNAALERVYSQLVNETKIASSTTVLASTSRAMGGLSCDATGKRLEDLVTISRELGKVKENSNWRLALAQHKTTCVPTPETLVVAYVLYTELGKDTEAGTTALRLGDEYLARFKSTWNVVDFNLATAYWEKAGVSSLQKGEALKMLALQAEDMQRYAAAIAIYEWLHDPAASELRPMLEQPK